MNRPRLGVRARLDIALGVVVAILAVVATDALLSIRQLLHTASQVTSGQETRAALQSVLASLSSAESGQRAYIVTGDTAFLAHVARNRATAERDIETLYELMEEHPTQTARLDSLRPMLERRFALLERYARVRRERGFAAAAALVGTREGSVLTDSIAALVAAMDRFETAGLAPGVARAESRARRAILVTLGGLIGALIAYAALGAFVRRALERQRTAEAAHLAATRQYESVVSVLAEGIVVQDAEGKVVDCNPAAELILGLPRERILQLADADFDWAGIRENGEVFPKQDHPALTTLRTGLPVRNVIMGINRPKLGLRWLLINSQPLRDPETNQLTGVVSSFSDITRRKEAEERLRDVLDNAAEMIVTTDGDGRILYANAAFCEVMGFPDAAAILGRSTIAMVPEDFRERAAADFERLRRGETVTGECHFVASDGRHVIVSRNANGKREGDRLVAVRMFMRDITARKLAERRLEMQYAVARIIATSADVEDGAPRLLEAIADTLGWDTAGMWLYDEDAGLARFAAHWSRDLQRTRPFIERSASLTFRPGEGLVGRVLASESPEWVAEVVSDPRLPRAQAALEAGLHAGFGFPLQARSRTVGVIELLATERQAPDRDLLELMTATGRQIGQFIERVRAQREAIAAREAAEQASRAKSDFLASMSHELRTPLNSVIGFANVLLKNRGANLTPQDIQFVERILDNGKHLLGLINGILDLAKVESGNMELEITQVHLDRLVAETLAQLHGHVRDRPVELRADLPTPLEPIAADAQKLKQVLINLVGNALKFTEKGSVMVRVAADPATAQPVRIDVVDTGIGIPAERQQAVFEAFQQADTTTSRKYGGTGLGLAITRSLLQLMGYRITLESEVGRGSTFSVHLVPADTPAGAVAASPGDRRVLVIDDDPDSRLILTQLLADIGCETLVAAGGAQGLRLAREHHPDLITLDLLMPKMDGMEVLAELRSDPALARIPVVVVSIVASESREKVVGVAGLLDKPVAREDLEPLIRDIFAGQEAAPLDQTLQPLVRRCLA